MTATDSPAAPPRSKPPLPPCTATVIRRKARALARRHRWPDQDRDDLAQSLWFEAIKAWRRYGEVHPCPEAFIHVVLERRAKSMVRDRFAQCRDMRRVCDQTPVEGLALVDASDQDLALDFLEQLARLTGEQRRLVEQLRNMTLSQISRATDVPRATLYERLRPIRRHLQNLADIYTPDRDK